MLNRSFAILLISFDVASLYRLAYRRVSQHYVIGCIRFRDVARRVFPRHELQAVSDKEPAVIFEETEISRGQLKSTDPLGSLICKASRNDLPSPENLGLILFPALNVYHPSREVA